MRKSASVFIPSTARKYTLPPSPPSPPSGPPKGTNFSRRKLTEPRPPLPACTLSLASSTNFIADIGVQRKTPVVPGFPLPTYLWAWVSQFILVDGGGGASVNTRTYRR